MGTLVTIIIGTAVIGYAVIVIVRTARKANAGQCSGCGHCPEAHKCSEKH